MEIKTVSLEIETVSKEQKLLPGLNMTQEELIARIRKAEEGPFYALDAERSSQTFRMVA